jgi:hypothetical protein
METRKEKTPDGKTFSILKGVATKGIPVCLWINPDKTKLEILNAVESMLDGLEKGKVEERLKEESETAKRLEELQTDYGNLPPVEQAQRGKDIYESSQRLQGLREKVPCLATKRGNKPLQAGKQSPKALLTALKCRQISQEMDKPQNAGKTAYEVFVIKGHSTSAYDSGRIKRDSENAENFLQWLESGCCGISD